MIALLVDDARIIIPILTTIVMFALSVPVAFFTAWAFALWAAIPL